MSRLPAAGPWLGAPIENNTAPPTGWPSAEITRQLSTLVPCRSSGGVSVTVVFSALTVGVIAAPSGPISRMTSGVTGSLKSNRSVAGESASTAPSAGSDASSEACAHAGAADIRLASAKLASSTTNNAAPASAPRDRSVRARALPCRRPLTASAAA